MDCQKKQKEIYKGTPQDRCIHKDAETYKEIVTDEICASCPVRMLPREEKVSCDRNFIDVKQINLPVIEPNGYPSCPFRYESTEGKACSITNLPVTQEICTRCDSETREREATTGQKATNYFGAIRRWVAHGCPTRTPEEVQKLFDEHCSGCARYDKEKHACINCGCSVNSSSSPLSNKLAMGTERCPLGRF